MISLLEYFDFGIKDCIEIFFFSAICYYFSLWLAKDHQKNLLAYFYGYCLIALGSYYCNLSTIAFFLFTGFPIATMLFIILHQDILQRNFVALHNINSNIISFKPNLWHEILMRSCLVLFHKQKPTVCVIEQHHSLKNFIETSFIFDTPLQEGLLELLLQDKKSLKKKSFIWLNSEGILKSIECTWAEHKITLQKNNSLPNWQQEALLFTTKTDALIIGSDLEQGTFSFIARGKRLEGLTADQMVRILHKYLQKSDSNLGVTSHADSRPPEHHF